ncbi:hypothetical protein OKW21_001343 [Catalinimonas alkaloidigena]|nr:hypothetical protein [Catalinimonas alkaloidigena]
MKLADMPSRLEGGDNGINADLFSTNRSVEVRPLPLQLIKKTSSYGLVIAT